MSGDSSAICALLRHRGIGRKFQARIGLLVDVHRNTSSLGNGEAWIKKSSLMSDKVRFNSRWGKRYRFSRCCLFNDQNDYAFVLYIAPFARAVPGRTSRRHSDEKGPSDTRPTLCCACPQGQMLEPLAGGPLRQCQRQPPSRSLLQETLRRRFTAGPLVERPHHSESVSGPKRAGRCLPPGAHLRRLAVRNAGARRTAIGVHHHAPRVALFVGRPDRPHEGEGCRRHQQDRQFQRTLLLRLDADRDRRARALLRHPLSARTVEPAMAPAPIVQQQPNNPNSERLVARRR